MIGVYEFMKVEKIEKLSDNIIRDDIGDFRTHLEKLKNIKVDENVHRLNILRSGAKARINKTAIFTGYVASGIAVVAIIVAILGVVATFSASRIDIDTLRTIIITLMILVGASAALGAFNLILILIKSQKNKHYEQIIEICNML